MHIPGWTRRLILTLVFAFGAVLIAAIVIAIVDLYLSGHNLPALGRPWLEWSEPGVHVSRADVIMYIVFLAAGLTVWFAGRGGRY